MLRAGSLESNKAARRRVRKGGSTRNSTNGFEFTDVNFDPQTLTFTWRWDGPKTTQFFFEFCRPGLTPDECFEEPLELETCGVQYWALLPYNLFKPDRFGFIIGAGNPQGIILDKTDDGLYKLNLSTWVFEDGKDSFKALVENLCCGRGTTITYSLGGAYLDEFGFYEFVYAPFYNLVDCTPECCTENALEISKNAESIGELKTVVAVQETKLDTLRADVDDQGGQLKEQRAKIDALQVDVGALQETQQRQQDEIDGNGRILTRQGAQIRELGAVQRVQENRINNVEAIARNDSRRITATQIALLAGAVAALALSSTPLSGRG